MSGDLIVVPCSGAKVAARYAEAGQLYTGTLHRAARMAADALDGHTVILSANYGLLELAQRVENYSVTFGEAGAVPVNWVADQLARYAPARVVSLCPGRYTAVLAEAAQAVGVELVAPLAGAGGVGVMRGRLRAIREAGAL